MGKFENEKLWGFCGIFLNKTLNNRFKVTSLLLRIIIHHKSYSTYIFLTIGLTLWQPSRLSRSLEGGVKLTMSLESSTTAAGEHSSPSHHHRAPRFRARSLQKVNEWGDASEPRKVQKRYTNSDTNGTEYEEYQYGSTLITRDKDGVFPIEFSCSNLVQEDWLPLSDAVVSFDLEASFIKDTDVMSNVRALEWSLLNILAETIGLKNDCDLKVQHEDLRRSLSSNPRRALTQTYLDYPTAIISLSSDPDDAHSATTGKHCSFHSIVIEKALDEQI